MVSYLRATDIPKNRVDALHILALNDDDIEDLTPEQVAALRKIYRLDDPRRIEVLVRVGVLRV